jgi:HAE1 family hydrophobic/amphiphilic exporter-1
MNLIQKSIEQPITVAVGIFIALIAGLIAITRVPVQMTPEIDDTIIAVTTRWENASPQEIESEVIDKQEEKLQGLANLKNISSISELGSGQIRLEFETGTNKEHALREVSDKLREIPSYPANVDEPVIEASDPNSNDFIAWFLLKSDDEFDIQTLQDFTQDRVKPILERTPGLSEVNVLGGREKETQIIFDPNLLAQHRISITELTRVLRGSNQNLSAGALQHGKYDLRVRTVGRFNSPEDITNLIIRQDSNGKVILGDVAKVKETYKEKTGFVRNNGKAVLAINFQREPGSNVIEVMKSLKVAVNQVNMPGSILDTYAKENNIKNLRLVQVYDQTEYIDQAFSLVQGSLIYGSILATVILMVFLRSFSAVGIIAISIPISVVGAVVGMVLLGRSVNVISLAGMSFAVGMVVDNAIVVLENIYRHAEMGKSKFQASLDGTKEVGGAVLASTLTTLLVFIPILLIEESAGQLLRDISLAIVVSVGLSYIVSITVIPSGAALFLKPNSKNDKKKSKSIFNLFTKSLSSVVFWINANSLRRILFVLIFSIATFFGIYKSIPPIDYLPTGNKNLVFGLILPPPGLNVEEFDQMAHKVEDKIKPYWEANGNSEKLAKLEEVPIGFMPDSPKVRPAAVKHYFIVAFPGMLFHGGICADETKVVDQVALFNNATSQFVLPGVFGFAFQAPLFQIGGNSGNAIKLDITGTDLKKVTPSALAILGTLAGKFGPFSTRPDPGIFIPQHLSYK